MRARITPGVGAPYQKDSVTLAAGLSFWGSAGGGGCPAPPQKVSAPPNCIEIHYYIYYLNATVSILMKKHPPPPPPNIFPPPKSKYENPSLVDNIYHSQNISSNCNETLTVTRSHSAETVEFRSGLKLLRLALRFHISLCRYRVSATPNQTNATPASCERGLNQAYTSKLRF